ncbi:NifB/NifX family molybdenum-iron cluster-binding protein [Methanococcoides burtonii]|uniref:Protein with dinitrogenase iron-molybdenum cofactor biosynthesis-like domain n=1 Tax=Methanococcoides burtonii (strain DSM 6242 / NBRC 107633 / OCM 468 / ACE-M) TaxID=259564 RepID=Q12Y84_METBU|nr:NifB/NifX family molybdenum-iron cluster-binding protein [Methanococcoides burtonii]ABE51592.1 Protein with dinitrogenase iron-molybdenum cofactor biosynthesis-like domain [Methanococcoides burtonii DSM 6242]
MKICVTATDKNLNAALDLRFGRCPYFIIVDSETMEFKAVDNSAASAAGGAGIQAAQNISDKGIDVLLTGSIGPNAFPILSAAGIQVMTGASGSVTDAISQYKEGQLQETGGPTAQAHASIAPPGKGVGGRRSGGSGRGMGGGGGAGRGGGMNR